MFDYDYSYRLDRLSDQEDDPLLVCDACFGHGKLIDLWGSALEAADLAPADIGRQFLVEATLLSGVGGAVGVGMGILGALAGGAIIAHFKPTWLTLISQPAVVVALSSSALIGLGFGYWPARTASRLDPVVAIRSQ